MPGQTEPWQSYPPEVNAGRILGPGPATWDAVATGWDEVAKIAQEQLIALGLQGVMLATNWKGQSGMQALGNLIPYGQWLMEMGENAKKNAEKARQVVHSYNSTTSSMIPVQQVSANRAQAAKAQAEIAAGAGLALLNPFAAAKVSQAKMELAQLEAQYSAYWQQNASAMQKYDTELAKATKPIPVKDPPKLASGGAGASHAGSFSSYNPGAYTYAPSTYTAGQYSAGSYTPGKYDSAAYRAGETARSSLSNNYTTTRGSLPSYTSQYANTASSRGANTYASPRPSNVSGAGTSSTFANARSSAPSFARSFGSGNALGNFRALTGAGGLNPNFRGTVSAGAASTGGLGLPKAGGTVSSSSAFGGVRPTGAASTSSRPLGSGMSMFPPGAAGAGRKSSDTAGADTRGANIQDEDSDVLAGISAVHVAPEDDRPPSDKISS